MKAIINCAAIKKVFLVDEYNTIELRMEFFDEETPSILKRRTFSSSSDKEKNRKYIDRIYSEIKDALLNGSKYIDMEI